MNPKELATAVRMYQAAVQAGANPNTALFLVGAAYQESSFNPGQTGSDSGTSYGLMQVGRGLWDQMQQAGVANDPVAQMTYYVNYLQNHQPGTWEAMQSAPNVQGVFQGLYANRDWRLGAQTGVMAPVYADQLAQILNQQQPSNWQLSDQNLGQFGAGAISPLSDAYPLYQSFGAGYPLPTIPGTSFPIQDFSLRNPDPVTGFTQPNPVDSFGLRYSNPAPSFDAPTETGFPLSNPVPSTDSFNPVDSFGFYNPDPASTYTPTETGFPLSNPDPASTYFPTETGYQPQNPAPTEEFGPTPVDEFQVTPYDISIHDWNAANDQFGEGGWYYDAQGNPVPNDPFGGAQAGASATFQQSSPAATAYTSRRGPMSSMAGYQAMQKASPTGVYAPGGIVFPGGPAGAYNPGGAAPSATGYGVRGPIGSGAGGYSAGAYGSLLSAALGGTLGLSGPDPTAKGQIAVSESAQAKGGDANDEVDAYIMSHQPPKQYPLTWGKFKNPMGNAYSVGAPNATWGPTSWTTDPSLQTFAPASTQRTVTTQAPGWQAGAAPTLASLWRG